MDKLEKALALLALIAVLQVTFAAYSSENYSIPNISIGQGGLSSSSENFLLYDAAEESIGSARGTSQGYNLWVGFPATIGSPRFPGSLQATVNSTSQITVSWDANGNPTGTIFQLQESSPVSQSLYSGSNTSYVHLGLSAGSQYCYKAKAFNGVYTGYTAMVCAATLPKEPVVSSTHSQSAFDSNSLVSFTATSDANHFFYAWDQLADTSVSTGNTWWNGLVLVGTS